MGIYHLEQSKKLKGCFKEYGRAGLSQRILDLAKELIEKGSYFDAIRICGQMHAIAIAAKADGYWNEKASAGFEREVWFLTHHRAEIEKDESGDVVKCEIVKKQQPPADGGET